DHIGGLFMLLQGFWLEERQKELTLNLAEDAIEPLIKMLQAAYLFPEVLPFRVHFETLAAAATIALGSTGITPYPTSQLDALKKTFQARYPGEYAAYSFLIESGKHCIAHSADL